jgi:hypothetical protein
LLQYRRRKNNDAKTPKNVDLFSFQALASENQRLKRGSIVMINKTNVTRKTTHEGTATWLRHVPVVLIVALRQKAKT